MEDKNKDLLLKSHLRTEHPFTMWEQIHSAPDILRGCLKDDVVLTVKTVAKAIVDRNTEEVIFTGTGTSFYSGLIGEYGLAELAGMSARFMTSHELKNYPPSRLNEQSVMVGISHSGGTLVGAEALQLAKDKGALTVAITDVPGSRMANIAEYSIIGPGGQDTTIPKTRSYMSGIFRVLMLVVAIADVKRPGTWEVWMKYFEQTPRELEKVIALADEATPKLAEKFLKTKAFYCISYGVNLMTAQESALKLLEASLAMAQGLQAEEAIHGPLTALDENCALVLIAPPGKGYERVERVAKGIHHFGVPILSLADPESEIRLSSDYFIGIQSDLPELLSPLLYIAPLYLLSYWIALHNKINPDILKSDNSRWVEAHLLMMPPGSH